jgi:hypothetical protein
MSSSAVRTIVLGIILAVGAFCLSVFWGRRPDSHQDLFFAAEKLRTNDASQFGAKFKIQIRHEDPREATITLVKGEPVLITMGCPPMSSPDFWGVIWMELFNSDEIDGSNEPLDSFSLFAYEYPDRTVDGFVPGELEWRPEVAPGQYWVRLDLVERPANLESGLLPRRHFLGSGIIVVVE